MTRNEFEALLAAKGRRVEWTPNSRQGQAIIHHSEWLREIVPWGLAWR